LFDNININCFIIYRNHLLLSVDHYLWHWFYKCQLDKFGDSKKWDFFDYRMTRALGGGGRNDPVKYSRLITGFVTSVTGAICRTWTAFPFRSTWVHTRFLVEYESLDFSFLCNVLQIIVCRFDLFSLFYLVLWFTASDYAFGSFKLFLSFCPFVLFLLAILLSVLRFTAFDYPFGIFKLFLNELVI
jgi:hypothetical protein